MRHLFTTLAAALIVAASSVSAQELTNFAMGRIRESGHFDADLRGIKNGIPHTLYVSDDAHVWKNWRLYLNTFARLLFK